MSAPVKRYMAEVNLDPRFRVLSDRVVVLASDYDALAQRCRELEAERSRIEQARADWEENATLLEVERDTLRAILTAARDKLGPAIRSGHPALMETVGDEVLAMLEAACK